MLFSKYLISISEEKRFAVKYEVLIYKPGKGAFQFHFIETTPIVKISEEINCPVQSEFAAMFTKHCFT